MVTVEYVKTEEELTAVLRLCYRLLTPELMVTLPGGKAGETIRNEMRAGETETSGTQAEETGRNEIRADMEKNGKSDNMIPAEVSENIYAYNAWKERMKEFSSLLLYAKEEGELAAAVLGRPESAESLVCGMVACDERFRRRGIAKMLLERFAKNAREMGFHYITLGADQSAEEFYEKCGFHVIFEIHGQKIYQKMLV